MTASEAVRQLDELREIWAQEIEECERRRKHFVWLADLEEAFLSDARKEFAEIEQLLQQCQQQEAA